MKISNVFVFDNTYIAFLSGLRSFEANSGKTSRNRIFGPGWVGSSCLNKGVNAKRIHSLKIFSFKKKKRNQNFHLTDEVQPMLLFV